MGAVAWMKNAMMNILLWPTLFETIARGILATIMRIDWTERMSPTWTREAPISRM